MSKYDELRDEFWRAFYGVEDAKDRLRQAEQAISVFMEEDPEAT